MTSSAFHKLLTLVKYDQEEAVSPPSVGVVDRLQIDTQTPFVPYKRTILEEIPEDILPSKGESSNVPSVEQGIIEPSPDQSLNNNVQEEATTSPNTAENVQKE